MKALTVRQPWAWAIIHGGKNVENRGAGFTKTYRGPLLIHASGAWSERGRLDARVDNAYRRVAGVGERDLDRKPIMGKPDHVAGLVVHGSIAHHDPRRRIHLGAIIGHAQLVDAHTATEECCATTCNPWGEMEYVGSDGKLHRGVTHLVLEDAAPFHHDGVIAKGRLGLWEPPPDVLEDVDDAWDWDVERPIVPGTSSGARL